MYHNKQILFKAEIQCNQKGIYIANLSIRHVKQYTVGMKIALHRQGRDT